MSGVYSYSTVVNTDKANMGEDSAYYTLLYHIPSLREVRAGSQARTWRQDLKQRPWRNAAYVLAYPDLLSLLPYITQNYLPQGGTTQNGLAPLT